MVTVEANLSAMKLQALGIAHALVRRTAHQVLEMFDAISGCIHDFHSTGPYRKRSDTRIAACLAFTGENLLRKEEGCSPTQQGASPGSVNPKCHFEMESMSVAASADCSLLRPVILGHLQSFEPP